VNRARQFYEEKIGLVPREEFAGGVVYECGGGSWVFLYPSAGAGTSQASQAFWQVSDIAAEVAELKARGVIFEDTICRASRRSTALPRVAAARPPGSRTARGIFWP